MPHFSSILDPVIWAHYGNKTLADIVSSDGLRTFDVLKGEQGLPNFMFFRYIQLHHAYWTQFPKPITLEANGLEQMLTLEEDLKPLSALYAELIGLDTSAVSRLFSRWQTDIPTLADDDWEEGIKQYLPLMISARDRFTKLRFLHRVYYSPERLAKIYPDRSVICPKCNSETGSFFHVIWSCQHLQLFWRGMVTDINAIGQHRVPCDPLLLLLGIVDNLEAIQAKKQFVFYTAFYARKAVLLKRKDPAPPTVQQWRALVDAALPFYKLTYLGPNCPKKFEKIWGTWIRVRQITVD